MQMLDASSIIYAWDNYPLTQFPGLWKWLSDQIAQHEITISSVALTEVNHVTPDCSKWLADCNIESAPVTANILQDALRIKNLLGIVGDQYGTGVDENDLIIIAAARSVGAHLISNEAVQHGASKKKANYKIPAVCAMPDVKVECSNFVDFVKRSKVIFG